MVTPTPRQRGRKGVETRKRRLALTNGLCEHCLAEGRTTLAVVVNHKIPLVHGGPDTDDNTENLCKPCDLIATAKQFGHRKRMQFDAAGWPVA